MACQLQVPGGESSLSLFSGELKRVAFRCPEKNFNLQEVGLEYCELAP